MKKIIAGMMMAAAMVAAADMRVGTVDLQILVKNHPSYESNKALLESTDKDYQKRLDAMKSELEKIQEDGKKKATEYENPMLAAAAKAKLEKELREIQAKFMSEQSRVRSEAMRSQQELSDLEARLLKTQTEDLKKRIANFAAKEKYDLIVDSMAAMYAKPSLDVTDEILKAMGVDPKKVRAKEENESK